MKKNRFLKIVSRCWFLKPRQPISRQTSFSFTNPDSTPYDEYSGIPYNRHNYHCDELRVRIQSSIIKKIQEYYVQSLTLTIHLNSTGWNVRIYCSAWVNSSVYQILYTLI